ncbi:MAG: hypothetical protein RLZZ263_1105, partial [Cyanobacteriota bacterium]
MATGTLSVKLEGGWFGTINNNAQEVIDAKENAFSSYGIIEVYFEQDYALEDQAKFTKQGNNIPGRLVLKTENGVIEIKGEIGWVEKDQGKVELLGFIVTQDTEIPTFGTKETLILTAGDDSAPPSNIALDLAGSIFSDGQFKDIDNDKLNDDIKGSADLQAALDALNDQLVTTVTVTTDDVTENDPGVTFNFQLSNPPEAG